MYERGAIIVSLDVLRIDRKIERTFFESREVVDDDGDSNGVFCWHTVGIDGDGGIIRARIENRTHIPLCTSAVNRNGKCGGDSDCGQLIC